MYLMSSENYTWKVKEKLCAVNAQTTWVLSMFYICVDKKSPVTKIIIQHYFSSAM